MKKELNKGFTLVELSIVLVIIGLLTSGILIARSMIETAKVTAIIRQIQQYDAAVNNFQTKYNSLPGDSKAFGCVDGVNGNVCGNGIIGDDGLFTPRYFAAETANFWTHMQQSGFYYSKTFTPIITGSFNSSATSANAPTISANSDGSVIVAYCFYNTSKTCYLTGDWKNLDISLGAAQHIFDTNLIFKPGMAMAIDAKIDDSLPNSGSVGVWSANSLCEDVSNTTYAPTNNGVACDLRFELQSQTTR